MATYQTEVSVDGFDVIRLSNSCLSVSIMPQLGGKIYEIVDLRTGRDWLWKNPYIPLQQPLPGMDYDRELDSGGWDEILFSVKPCQLELPGGHRSSIGDHGVVVYKAWQSSETGVNSVGEAVCELFAEGQFPHFKLQRRIVLDAEKPRLVFMYKLTNTGPIPWPWLWCAHPLLAIESDMLINFQEGQQIRNETIHRSGKNEDMVWPTLVSAAGERIDLARIFEKSRAPETFCAKLFIRSANEVCLSTEDGSESFGILYDPDVLPWLGLWVNKNAWSGCGSEPYLNLGMEPATSPHDRLTQAVAKGESDFLQPAGTREWTLTICLKNTVNADDSTH